MTKPKPTAPLPPHPMQPVVIAEDGCIRFRENKLVRYLLDQASAGKKCDMNDLSMLRVVGLDEYEQFAQLIGYSVSGFGDLSYVRNEVYEKAAAQSDALRGDMQFKELTVKDMLRKILKDATVSDVLMLMAGIYQDAAEDARRTDEDEVEEMSRKIEGALEALAHGVEAMIEEG